MLLGLASDATPWIGTHTGLTYPCWQWVVGPLHPTQL